MKDLVIKSELVGEVGELTCDLSNEFSGKSAIDLKKFRLGNLSEKLPDNRLKEIIAGYGDGTQFTCFHDSSAGSGNCTVQWSLTMAILWCDYWVTAGYWCKCVSNDLVDCP